MCLAATPFLSVLVSASSRRLLWTFVAACFVAPVLDLYSHFTGHTFYVAAFTPPLEYVGYYVLGYLLKDARPPKWVRLALYVSAVVVVAGTAFITYQLSVAAGGVFDGTLFEYTVPTNILVACAVWYGAHDVRWERLLRWQWSRTALTTLGLATYGIYLLHMITKVTIEQIPAIAQAMPIGSMRYVLLDAPLIFVVSALVIVALRSLPGASRIIAWLVP